jgi:hypothetical protein
VILTELFPIVVSVLPRGERNENTLFIMAIQSKKTIQIQAQKLANLTKLFISQGNLQRAKKCFDTAEALLVNGSAETKNAVSNIYLFSVSSFMEINHYTISGMLPIHLRNEYYKQVNTSGL